MKKKKKDNKRNCVMLCAGSRGGLILMCHGDVYGGLVLTCHGVMVVTDNQMEPHETKRNEMS